MTELELAAQFEASSREAWLGLVSKALKGGDFERKLVGRTYDGIRLEPLYTRADELPEAGPATRGIGARRQGLAWDILQLHAGSDAAAVNRAVVEDLEGGCSGLALQLAAPGQAGLGGGMAALDAALKSVRLDWIVLSLAPGAAGRRAADDLVALAAARGLAGSALRGGLNADPLGTLARTGGLDTALEDAGLGALVRQVTRQLPAMTALLADARPYHDAGASEAQELACLAATVAAYLRLLDAEGIAPAEAFPKLAVALSADAQIFATIAKLRAARTLIARIAEACGVPEAALRTHLTVETSRRMMARRDAYTNMLRTTVACAGASMGGADAIIVLPFSWALGAPDAFARRMARNTQIVLMEESSLGRVADPAGGAWYVEKLTAELAAKAWTLFQEIEAKGGMLTALQSGHVQAMIAKTAEERSRNLAVGREELIGVANFPDLKETTFTVEPHGTGDDVEDAAITVEPLPLRRLAAPLEALRDAADAHTARTGARPRIFLANIGTLPEFNARATFAQNFFAAGGIETLTNDGFATSAEAARAFAESGAGVACICSSDANYEVLAEATAMALKGAGAAHVYLAGRPGERLEAYRAAGIGSFIYMGCDAPQTLAAAHGVLGVRQ